MQAHDTLIKIELVNFGINDQLAVTRDSSKFQIFKKPTFHRFFLGRNGARLWAKHYVFF
jgi:hypothetical protein